MKFSAMVLIEWLFFGMLLESTPPTPELISVGNDFNCHYQPSQLTEAMKSHEQLHLTNQFIIPQLKIEVPVLHLIGGFDDCNDIIKGGKSHGRTQISGMGEASALSVYGFRDNNSIVIENFEMTQGRSPQGAGVYVAGPVRFVVINSLIHNNHSSAEGGGVFVFGDAAQIEIVSSQIYNNSATAGGGLAVKGVFNLVTLIDTTVFDNDAFELAGGVYCINQNSVENIFNTEIDFAFAKSPTVFDNDAKLGADYFFDLNCQLKLQSRNFNGFVEFN